MSGLVLGPLEYDVYCIQNSRKYAANNPLRGRINLDTVASRNHSDVALIEILLDRSIPDLLLLRTAYEARYRDLLAIIPLYLKPRKDFHTRPVFMAYLSQTSVRIGTQL
jgi:hypothetical protein